MREIILRCPAERNGTPRGKFIHCKFGVLSIM
jgi:hypothetical protein